MKFRAFVIEDIRVIFRLNTKTHRWEIKLNDKVVEVSEKKGDAIIWFLELLKSVADNEENEEIKREA